jgi:hypothetical protein
MVIMETSVFTKQILDLLSDEEYRKLRLFLAKRPEAGALIEGSGGLRKMRWALPGWGKRGGVRVIDYWAVRVDRLLLLLIYAKGEVDDLTPRRVAVLHRIVQEE